MPNRPATLCRCGGVLQPTGCTRCGKKRTSEGWHHTKTSTQRGYDKDWRKVRAVAIRDATEAAALSGAALTPLCALCGKPIDGKRQMHVDHVNGFSGVADPARLDVGNCRVVHAKCHMEREAAKSRNR